MTELNHRYDFALIFDVKDGNPNGDPDAGNLPRIDPETGEGLVSDVCLKRKIRNYVLLTQEEKEGYDIFIKEKGVLNNTIAEMYASIGVGEGTDADKGGGKEGKGKEKEKKSAKAKRVEGEDVDKGRAEMCRRFFDVRTFGAVMSTGMNAGQVRGPVQITFARSVHPILTQEHAITRMAVATEKEAEDQKGDNRTMGRKMTVPYGLYLGHGFISASFAKQTGFSEEDLSLLWKALENMFEHDRSAARGLMSLQKLVIFRHASALGNAPAHKLFDLISLKQNDERKPPRSFSDFSFALGSAPEGVEATVLPN